VKGMRTNSKYDSMKPRKTLTTWTLRNRGMI